MTPGTATSSGSRTSTGPAQKPFAVEKSRLRARVAAQQKYSAKQAGIRYRFSSEIYQMFLRSPPKHCIIGTRDGTCEHLSVTRYNRQDVLRILQVSARQLQGWERAGLIDSRNLHFSAAFPTQETSPSIAAADQEFTHFCVHCGHATRFRNE